MTPAELSVNSRAFVITSNNVDERKAQAVIGVKSDQPLTGNYTASLAAAIAIWINYSTLSDNNNRLTVVHRDSGNTASLFIETFGNSQIDNSGLNSLLQRHNVTIMPPQEAKAFALELFTSYKARPPELQKGNHGKFIYYYQ